MCQGPEAEREYEIFFFEVAALLTIHTWFIFSEKLGTAGLTPLSHNSCLSSFITGHLLKVFTGKITHNSFYLLSIIHNQI